jgi:hypothetical protein
MKRFLLALSSAVIALVLPGCLQSETTIHVNKDGSGTLVEQTTLGGQMLAMIDQMAAMGGGGADAKDPLAEMFSEEKAMARAASLGEGVTFEKSEPVTAGANKGAKTTYKFVDINTLVISPGDNMKDLSPMGAQAPAGPKQEPIRFTFADGTLTINMPKPDKADVEKGAAEAAEAQDQNPQMEEMMKQMLGDMKISLKLVADGGISETNATNRAGNTITLMEMEMGKLMQNPETMKKLTAASNDDPEAAMKMLKGIDGVKMETQEKVTVKLD